MTSADQTRHSYDLRPYPDTRAGEALGQRCSLPSLKWIRAWGRPGLPPPQRVLVAGCGTGAEAFFLRRHWPHAEIVAVDFSPRSITRARRLQRSAPNGKPIRFAVVDLTDLAAVAQLGEPFDLITCHGVLSYIPAPQSALIGLGSCLARGGALYLGVNGEAHPALRLRPWLSRFGLRMDEMRDEPRLRTVLGLWDSLHDDGIGGLAGMSASYLASDVCGPHFNNWSLARWRTEFRASGWEIVGSSLLPLALRLTLEGDHWRLFTPSNVGELAESLDHARPASFHQLLLRRPLVGGREPGGGPGSGPDLAWYWTGLYTLRLGRPDARGRVPAVLSCASFKLSLAWVLSRRQVTAVKKMIENGSAPAGWLGQWGRSETDRRALSIWAGLGIVAPGEPGICD